MQQNENEYIDNIIKQLRKITKRIPVKRKGNEVYISNFNIISRLSYLVSFMVFSFILTTFFEDENVYIYYAISTIIITLLLLFLRTVIIINVKTLNLKIKKFGTTIFKGHTGNSLIIKIYEITAKRTSTAGGNNGTSIHCELRILLSENKELTIDHEFTSEEAYKYKALLMSLFIHQSEKGNVYRYW
jgi:hypothetical protein